MIFGLSADREIHAFRINEISMKNKRIKFRTYAAVKNHATA